MFFLLILEGILVLLLIVVVILRGVKIVVNFLVDVSFFLDNKEIFFFFYGVF